MNYEQQNLFSHKELTNTQLFELKSIEVLNK